MAEAVDKLRGPMKQRLSEDREYLTMSKVENQDIHSYEQSNEKELELDWDNLELMNS